METTTIGTTPFSETLVTIRAILATSTDGNVRAHAGEDIAWMLWPLAKDTPAITSVQAVLTASLHRSYFPVAEIEALCVEVEANET